MIETSEKKQLEMFDFDDTHQGVLEIFPEIWQALNQLIGSSLAGRIRGFERLVALNAHRLSPIVAYVMATCLDDEDIGFRYKVVQTVGPLLSQDEEGLNTPTEVKKRLKFYLCKMRQRRVFALLQVAEYHPSAHTNVALLLKACSYAGNALADIFSDRKLPVEIRRQAIHFSGLVGFLDTVPRLEKLEEKLMLRMNGQRSLPFAPSTKPEERSLLTTVQTTLALLNAP